MPDAGPERPPWYAHGLRFECVADCGRCCVNHGDATYVYLEGDDARRLADHLGLPLTEFLDDYTEREDGLRLLRQGGEACRFLEGTRCGVHPVRPVQCRTFPFWRDHLRSRSTWTRLATLCPGIDRGRRHDRTEVEDHLRARRLGRGPAPR